jgi:hypothetical protein
MNAELIAEPHVSGDTVRVFALCLDSQAVERARWLTRQLAGSGAGPHEILAQTWTLASAINGRSIRDWVAQDAAGCDVLVIAMSYLSQREPALIQWLNSLTLWKQSSRRGALLLGLFGDEDRPAGELAWLVSELGSFARRTGRQFLWQWMADGAMRDTEWLDACIEECVSRDRSPQTLPVPAAA